MKRNDHDLEKLKQFFHVKFYTISSSVMVSVLLGGGGRVIHCAHFM